MKFTIITLFPEAIKPYLDSSMLFKAQKSRLAEFNLVNLRDYGLGPHKSVDDTPYGGGDGMLLRPEPVFAAIEAVKAIDPTAETILPTPVGTTWNQSLARQFANPKTSRAQKPLQTPLKRSRTHQTPKTPPNTISCSVPTTRATMNASSPLSITKSLSAISSSLAENYLLSALLILSFVLFQEYSVAPPAPPSSPFLMVIISNILNIPNLPNFAA